MDNINISILTRLLGALFYYSPSNPIMIPLLSKITEFDSLIPLKNRKLIQQQCQKLKQEICTVDLTYQHSLLFEGQGKIDIPPWGSIYLDNEQLIMGKSTQAYRLFLHSCGIKLNTGINEPEDQFGLMLMALALMIEKEQHKNASKLINNYLITWAPTYLTLLSNNTISPFYQALAVIGLEYLDMLIQRYQQ